VSARGSRRLATLVAAVPVMLTGTACYEYHSASAADIHPGETVHLVLRSDASSALAATIGPNATTLDGRVVTVDASAVRLAVNQIARSAGPEEFLKNEPIDVPLGGASSITVRSVDRVRTFVALGGVIAAAIAAHAAATSQPGIVTVKGGPSTGTK
jgi:hypothetical protein